MMRCHYYLHRYGLGDLKAVETFTSRRALSNYMRSLSATPVQLAEEYFLHVMTSSYSAVYDFVAHGDHLSAVLSRQSVYFF